MEGLDVSREKGAEWTSIGRWPKINEVEKGDGGRGAR